jgi:hypothetical protein
MSSSKSQSVLVDFDGRGSNQPFVGKISSQFTRPSFDASVCFFEQILPGLQTLDVEPLSRADAIFAPQLGR